MLRNCVALLVLLGAAGCSSESPLGIGDVRGLHNVVSVSGQALPIVLRESRSDAACLRAGATGDLTDRLSWGSLEFRQDGTFRLTFTRHLICTYATGPTAAQSNLTTEGTFSVQGRAVTLDPQGSGWSRLTADLRGADLVIATRVPGDVFDRTYVFRRMQ